MSVFAAGRAPLSAQAFGFKVLFCIAAVLYGRSRRYRSGDIRGPIRCLAEVACDRLAPCHHILKPFSNLSGAVSAGFTDLTESTIPRTHIRRDPRALSGVTMRKGVEKLEQLLTRADITEIMINGPRTFIEAQGKKQKSDLSFSEQEIGDIVQQLFVERGKTVSEHFPYADVTLDDGSRVNVIIPPLSRHGAALTIRKFSRELSGLEDLVKAGTLNQKMADFLTACLQGRLNILFSGGTGAGKTTTMEMLSRFIPQDERIITIEDTAELKLHHQDLVALETRRADAAGQGEVTLQDLIKNALRMRPDRIIIGEIRGAEALDFIQATATGHRGTLAVIHGSSPREIMARLETLILSSGINLPLAQIRQMLATSINIIVQQERFPDGRRRITHITEVVGLREQEIELRDLFRFEGSAPNPDGEPTGGFKIAITSFPKFYTDFVRHGILPENFFSR